MTGASGLPMPRREPTLSLLPAMAAGCDKAFCPSPSTVTASRQFHYFSVGPPLAAFAQGGQGDIHDHHYHHRGGFNSAIALSASESAPPARRSAFTQLRTACPGGGQLRRRAVTGGFRLPRREPPLSLLPAMAAGCDKDLTVTLTVTASRQFYYFRRRPHPLVSRRAIGVARPSPRPSVAASIAQSVYPLPACLRPQRLPSTQRQFPLQVRVVRP